jgi:hypothetical protein
VYEAATGDLAFGDIFSADWFFAAYLRRDARPLVEFTPSKPKIGRAWKGASPTEHRDFLFAHGLQREAILLADDCEAETVVKRRGSGRLLFAAIERLPVGPTARDQALSTHAFRSFPLPQEEGYAGGVVHFQQLFAMAVDGVVPEGVPDPRIARLASDVRLDLEMRWAAYATRRGPLTHIDNAEKLARLLTGGGDAERLERLRRREEAPEAEHLEAATEIARALGLAWELEGAALNDVAEAYEQAAPIDGSRDRLIELLNALAASAQRSAARLDATGSDASSA